MGQFGVPAIEQSSNQAIQQSSNGLTCRQIAAATGMNLATVRVRMWSLVRSGRVVAKGKRGRTFVYSLP